MKDDLRASRAIFPVLLAACIMILLAFAAGLAHATPPDNRPPDNRPPDRGNDVSQGQLQAQQQGQTQTAQAGAEAAAASSAESAATATANNAASATGGDGGQGGAGGAAEAGATASNDGVTVGGDSYNSESNNTNVVLVPNNNTAGCTRVFGLSFGNDGAAGGLGLPFRDKDCDFELAADDAAAMGEHDIAWFWRCHKKALYEQFEGDSREVKIKACTRQMVDLMQSRNSEDWVTQDQLMAQVSKEEYEEQKELVEKRITQQKNLIESLRDKQSAKDAEIERLKREAAKLRAEQKEQEQRDAARRAAALKALKKDEDE